MSGDSIRQMLQARPFLPFEVHLSSGDVHQVSHPELGWVAGSQLYVYYPDSERVAWCSLLQITSLEQSQKPLHKKKGGKS